MNDSDLVLKMKMDLEAEQEMIAKGLHIERERRGQADKYREPSDEKKIIIMPNKYAKGRAEFDPAYPVLVGRNNQVRQHQLKAAKPVDDDGNDWDSRDEELLEASYLRYGAVTPLQVNVKNSGGQDDDILKLASEQVLVEHMKQYLLELLKVKIRDKYL